MHYNQCDNITNYLCGFFSIVVVIFLIVMIYCNIIYTNKLNNRYSQDINVQIIDCIKTMSKKNIENYDYKIKYDFIHNNLKYISSNDIIINNCQEEYNKGDNIIIKCKKDDVTSCIFYDPNDNIINRTPIWFFFSIICIIGLIYILLQV